MVVLDFLQRSYYKFTPLFLLVETFVFVGKGFCWAVGGYNYLRRKKNFLRNNP